MPNRTHAPDTIKTPGPKQGWDSCSIPFQVFQILCLYLFSPYTFGKLCSHFLPACIWFPPWVKPMSLLNGPAGPPLGTRMWPTCIIVMVITIMMMMITIFISKYHESARCFACIFLFHPCLKCSRRHDSENNVTQSPSSGIQAPFRGHKCLSTDCPHSQRPKLTCQTSNLKGQGNQRFIV